MPAIVILEEFTDRNGLAEEFRKSPRTIDRWCAMPDGLPFVQLPKGKLFHIEISKKWLLKRMIRPNARRAS